MNKENERFLLTNFDFFDEYRPSTPGGERFECFDGWFKIINDLCERLEKLKLPSLKIRQVKQKLGSLRFYVDGANVKAMWLIDHAESLSEITCERCGQPGTFGIKKLAFRTRCLSCFKKNI